ncbi:LMBR1-like membrane protein-domain-containing protein [Chytriomyces sp. MP71]|nr:LMBR1-like membrane protein-domain-containing protein [Chytriomyces sp. MP71]
MILALILLGVLAVVVALLLWYFGDVRRHAWYSQVIAFVAWFFPFAIILILPLDLASTLHRKCQADSLALVSLQMGANWTQLFVGSNSTDNSTVLLLDEVDSILVSLNQSAVINNNMYATFKEYVSEICEEPLAYVTREFLITFWTAVYWTLQALTWLVVPIMLSFVRSGDFTLGPRIWGAIKENVIMYAIMGVGGIAFLIYMIVAVKFTTEALTAILMAAANAWGLLLCTCMLGYGLVEIPRDLWATASPARRLKALEIAAPKAKEKMIDSEAEVYEVARELSNVNHKVPDGDPLRVYIETMLAKCPLALDEKLQLDLDRRNARAKEITLNDLKDLHWKIKYHMALSERHQAQYRFLLERAWFLTDVVDNAKSTDYLFKSVFVKPATAEIDMIRLRFLWLWYLYMKPGLTYLFSVIFILASLALIWSESTFGIKSVPLSIPALLLKNNFISYASLEFISISFLIYMCTCAYSTLFKIKIFDYYVIVPEHCTDEPSLLFVGAYLCRLTFPLCYNFLNMVSDDENSVFVEYQGKAIDLAPLLGEGFNTWVPLLVFIVSTITYLNLFGRIGALCGGRSFVKDVEGRDADAIEGRRIIAQARSQEERRSGGAFSTVGADRLRSAGRTVNTQELLARYGRGPGVTIGNNTPARTSPTTSRAGGSVGAGTTSLSAAPIVSNAPKTGVSGVFGNFSAGLTSFSFGKKDGAGKYQKLEVEDAVASVVQEPSGSFTLRMMNMGGGAGSVSSNGTGDGATCSGKGNGDGSKSTRVFGNTSGTNSPAAARSPAPVPTVATGKKRNIFDDI